MDLTIEMVDSATITPEKNYLTVEMEGVSEDKVLSNFTLADVISHFGSNDLLDEIGQDEAIEHFDLDLKEETE